MRDNINHVISKSLIVGEDSFPTRNDYEEYCLGKGYAKAPDEVWENDHSVKMIQQHWHHTGQNGCVFAQSIAYKQEEIGWESKIIRNLEDQTLAELDEMISQAIADPHNEVISFLFPDVTTPEQVSRIVNSLVCLKNIRVGHIKPVGDLVSIGLRTPLGDEDVLSWLVAFAPLEYMPVTRQAPVFELAIRTKLKGDHLFYRLNDNQEEAHLADVALGYSDKTMERLWDATSKRTRKLLGGDEARKQNSIASAKVTIALPNQLCSFIENF